MRKDPTEFRERFLRWKKGELVYENGLALPAYEDGKISDELYISVMEKVAADNYKQWGFENEDLALLHALNDNTYNYRGYYDKYPSGGGNAIDHWTDEFKTVWHPTFSNESIYSGKKSQYNPKGLKGGRWVGEKFIPAKWQKIPLYEDGKSPRKLEYHPEGDYYYGGIPFEITVTGKNKKKPYWISPKGIGNTALTIGDLSKAYTAATAGLLPNPISAGINLSQGKVLNTLEDMWFYNSAHSEDPNVNYGVVGFSAPEGSLFSSISKAAKATPKQWIAAQDAAIARGDMAEAQRLRDLHFKVSAPNTKVVTSEQLPLKVYHGGQRGITSFYNPNENPNFKSNNFYTNPSNRVGIYTSDELWYAKQYARGYSKNNRQIYELYLNHENPREVSYWESQLNRLKNLNPFKKERALYPPIVRPGDKARLLPNNDGLKWDIERATFDGKNIKSADAVTYDNDGVRIPLGERDNFNINDIRYGLLPIIGATGYGMYKSK